MTLGQFIAASSPVNRAIILPWQEELAMKYYDEANACDNEARARYLRFWGDRSALWT